MQLDEAVAGMRLVIRAGKKDRGEITGPGTQGYGPRTGICLQSARPLQNSPKRGKEALNHFAGLLTSLTVKPITALLKELDPTYYQLVERR